MRKLRTKVAQSHRANKWQSWDSNSACLVLEFMFLQQSNNNTATTILITTLSNTNYPRSLIIVFILQMETVRPREVKEFPLHHTDVFGGT